MRKLIFLLFGLLFFNLGCDDGSVGGGGRFKVVATLQTPLTPGVEGIAGNNNYFTIRCQGFGPYYSGVQTTKPSPLTFTTDEIALSQGNLLVWVELRNGKDLGCQQVKIETFLNGAVFDTRTYNLGIVSLSPTDYCNDGYQLSYILIIP
jgi:hypothetical protein